jgi:hypothetical protein
MRGNKPPLFGAVALLATALVLLPGGAILSATASLTMQELADQSGEVVAATVASKESRWNETEDFIFTTVTLRVTTTYAGDALESDVLTVLVPGGEVDGVGLGVEHAADFTVGEEVIVFLRQLEDNVYGVTGWEQGKFTVTEGRVQEKDLPVADFEQQIREVVTTSQSDNPRED